MLLTWSRTDGCTGLLEGGYAVCWCGSNGWDRTAAGGRSSSVLANLLEPALSTCGLLYVFTTCNEHDGTRNRVQGDTYGRVNEFAAKIVSSGVSPNRLKFEVALSNLELVTQLDLIPYDSNEAVIFLPFKTSIFWKILKDSHTQTHKVPSDHLLLDSALYLGPLISHWEMNKFENYWYKSVKILEVLKLLFDIFEFVKFPTRYEWSNIKGTVQS